MTCIVGLIHDGKVWIGGDSGSFSGYDVSIHPQGKVFKVGEFLMGGSGSTRMCQLLRYAFEPPAIDSYKNDGKTETPPDLQKYMVTTFVHTLRQCFKDAGHAEVKDGHEEAYGYFLVGVRGRLFIVWSDYCVTEDDKPYAAIGCGSGYALGSLHGTDGKAPRIRVEKALKAAEAFSAGVRGPFTVLELKPHK
jgi:ATP-dependent protease HslVU (ClpYQ) peptidase subunit